MHSKDLVVNDCCDRQTVKAIDKCLPKLNAVSALAFIIEAVDAINRGAFVVAAQDEEVFRVFDLVS